MAADPRLLRDLADFLQHRDIVMPVRGGNLDPVLATMNTAQAESCRLLRHEISRVAVQDNEPEDAEGEERKGNHWDKLSRS